MKFFSGLTIKPHALLDEIIAPFDSLHAKLSNFVLDQQQHVKDELLLIEERKAEIIRSGLKISDHNSAIERAKNISTNIKSLVGDLSNLTGNKSA